MQESGDLPNLWASDAAVLTRDDVTAIDQAFEVDGNSRQAPESGSQSTDHEPRETKVRKPASSRDSSIRAKPETIGPYELMEQIGAGGMGAVFRAVHTRMNREVALKLLPSNCLGDIEAITRFDREMQAVGRLDHPNIVTGYDAGEADGHYYLAMEILRGVDLSTLCKTRAEPIPVGDVCEITRQVGLALQFAHQNGVFHRDVKPSNIMLCHVKNAGNTLADKDDQVTVKLLDLGLARFEKADSGNASLTGLSQVVGTVNYMSPEQCLDGRIVDARSDIYSLGATLYRMIAGETPWPSRLYETQGQKLQALLLMELPSVESVCPDLPGDLISLIDKSLMRDPNDRFQSMDEMLEKLSPLAEGHNLPELLNQATKALEHQEFEVANDGVKERRSNAGRRVTDHNPDSDTNARSVTIKKPSEKHDRHGAIHTINEKAGQSRVNWILLGLLPTILACAAIVFWLKTDGGYLKIQAEPGIDVTVDVIRDGKKIDSIRSGNEGQVCWYRSGNYEIRFATESTDGLTLSDNTFTLTRGANSLVTISKVTDDERDAELARGNTSIESSRSNGPTPNREIAEWVLANDGTIGTDQGEIKSVEGLPKGDFEIHRIGLRNVDNEKARKVCELIKGHKKCDQLYLNGGDNMRLDDEAIPDIGKLTQLKWLSIESAKISDQGIQQLPRMPLLRTLGLMDLLVTEKCLTAASVKFPNLTGLWIFSDSLQGGDLKPVTTMSKLRNFDLNTNRITRDLFRPVVSTKVDTMMFRGVEYFEEGVGELIAAMPELKDLAFQNCNFNDKDFGAVANAKSLKFLRLCDANISVDAMRQFLDLRHDVVVYLESSKSPLLELRDLPQIKDVSNGR